MSEPLAPTAADPIAVLLALFGVCLVLPGGAAVLAAIAFGLFFGFSEIAFVLVAGGALLVAGVCLLRASKTRARR